MVKKVIYGDEARKGIYDGVKTVADAVKVTMGPKGKNVILERLYGNPIVTNDGVTVAKDIELEDSIENIGANLVKETAGKTNEMAGDGTTTTVVLLEAIVKEGLRYINTGVNPFVLAKGLNKTTEIITNFLKENSVKIDTKAQVKDVATISSQDEEVGQLIADIIEEVGDEGVITVEESKIAGLHKDIVTGLQVDSGYVSPYFITDSGKLEGAVQNPYVIVTDERVNNVNDLIPIMEQISKSGTRNVVLFAEDIDGEALAFLVLNKMQGALNTIAVKAPGYGKSRQEYLKDIAIVTGATVISQNIGLTLKDMTIDKLGFADRITSKKDKTIIVGGKGRQGDINGRIEELKIAKSNETSAYEQSKLQERIGRLSGGVAVIRVGAVTEMETKNKKFKIEDALNATKSAIEEGIIPGGGTMLVKAVNLLNNIKFEDADEQIGVEILKQAIQYPVKQIANNAGYKGDLVVEKIIEGGLGFNAGNGQYCDLMVKGIIDAVKVIRVGLENAVSTAIMILTTDALVYEIKTQKEEGQ